MTTTTIKEIKKIEEVENLFKYWEQALYDYYDGEDYPTISKELASESHKMSFVSANGLHYWLEVDEDTLSVFVMDEDYDGVMQPTFVGVLANIA